MNTPRESVIKAIKDQMRIEAPHDDAGLVEDLHMDSLDILEAVMAVEADLAIRIDDEKVEGIVTVSDFIKLVEVSL